MFLLFELKKKHVVHHNVSVMFKIMKNVGLEVCGTCSWSSWCIYMFWPFGDPSKICLFVPFHIMIWGLVCQKQVYEVLGQVI